MNNSVIENKDLYLIKNEDRIYLSPFKPDYISGNKTNDSEKVKVKTIKRNR